MVYREEEPLYVHRLQHGHQLSLPYKLQGQAVHLHRRTVADCGITTILDTQAARQLPEYALQGLRRNNGRLWCYEDNGDMQ